MNKSIDGSGSAGRYVFWGFRLRRLQGALDRPYGAVPELLLTVFLVVSVQSEDIVNERQRAISPGDRTLEVFVHVTYIIEDVIVTMATRIYEYQVHDGAYTKPYTLREYVPPHCQYGIPFE